MGHDEPMEGQVNRGVEGWGERVNVGDTMGEARRLQGRAFSTHSYVVNEVVLPLLLAPRRSNEVRGPAAGIRTKARVR